MVATWILGRSGSPSLSVMKTVSHLNVNLTGFGKVRAANRVGSVQEESIALLVSYARRIPHD
jgi:hypothetical protein